MRWYPGAALAALLLVSPPAVAQGEVEDEEEVLAEEAAAGEASIAKRREALPEIGEDQLAVFVLKRGFYLSSDLGVFLTFGGVRDYSHLQPFLSLKAGFDVSDTLSVQAALSAGYSSGNPISKNDLAGAGGREVTSYSVLNAGAELVAAIRPTDRFAIEPKIGGGITQLSPAPTDPRNINKKIGPFVPHISAGLDVKYLTLLTDFTAGVSLSGYYILGPSIPAAAAAFVVRYTF